MLSKSLLVCIVSLIAICNAAENMDARFVLQHPLSNSTFKHWKALGSAIFLQEKAVLAPEIRNGKGLIYNKDTFNLPNFQLEVDLSIHNKDHSSQSRGDFHLYLLRDNPMKSAIEYASGLDGMFDGLHIHVQENVARNTDPATKDKTSRAHIIKLEVRNEGDYSLMTPERKPIQCEKAFSDQVIVLVYRKGKVKIMLRDTHGTSTKETKCAEYQLEDEDFFTEDHDAYIFMAAKSGIDTPNEHNIHNIRFYDINHLHDDQVHDSAAEMKPFESGKAQDQIRKGHVQMKQEYTLDSYNQQLVKHNKLYSTLVADFISNQEMIISHMHNLPNHQIIKNLTEMATVINSRFGLLEEQFTKYNTDVKSYKDYLLKVSKDRMDKRYEGGADDGNQFATEQKQIMDSIKVVKTKLDNYSKVVETNHLIEQIKKYDQNIKENDQKLVGQDDSLLDVLKNKNARDEFLGPDEMKTIMSQQIKKIMNKEVRSREKEVKAQAARGQMGQASKIVDYLMYMSILFVMGFGYLAHKKLQEQKDSLIM